MPAELADVYREHVAPVWRYVRLRVPTDGDAEDVTSQVFEKAVRAWATYDEQRGAVGAWLIGIARFTVADWWRRHGRELPVADPGADDVADDDPEGEVMRIIGADELRRRLGVLTPREREAVALRFGSEMTSEEIGATLGVGASAARMLVHRGVTRLREVMGDD